MITVFNAIGSPSNLWLYLAKRDLPLLSIFPVYIAAHYVGVSQESSQAIIIAIIVLAYILRRNIQPQYFNLTSSSEGSHKIYGRFTDGIIKINHKADLLSFDKSGEALVLIATNELEEKEYTIDLSDFTKDSLQMISEMLNNIISGNTDSISTASSNLKIHRIGDKVILNYQDNPHYLFTSWLSIIVSAAALIALFSYV